MVDTPVNSTHPKTRAEWRAWLEEHHTSKEGISVDRKVLRSPQ